MSFLASAALEMAGLALAILILISCALLGSISILNKRHEDPWDDAAEVESRLEQRLREAGE